MLLTILGLPMVGAQWMVALPTNLGSVAGTRSVSAETFNVIPNLKDFNGYVTFSPQSFSSGKYNDTLGLTAFRRQKATYYGVYTVYNVSPDRRLSVEIVSPGLNRQQSSPAFDRILLTLGEQGHSTTLKESVDKGATLLLVDEPQLFGEGDSIWVENEVAKVLLNTSDGLVVTPLMQRHNAGQTVFTGALVVEPGSLISPQTRTVILEPGARITVDATVWGASDVLGQDEVISLPLEFRVQPIQ